MSSEPVVSAKVCQVLDWYERPELILLQCLDLTYILAVRSGDLQSPAHRYIGAGLTFKRLRDYANGKFDLRYAIAHSNTRKYWKFDFDGSQQDVELKKISRNDAELKKSIPESGLFSADHEDIEVVKSSVPNTVEKFFVDGGWELGEFSSFYSQIEDIYYMSSDIDRFDDPQTSAHEKEVISDAFDRSWNGGGSYVAFYKRVANDNDYHTPLRVSGIQYNSPGYVSVHARSEVFSNVVGMLQNYADNEEATKINANALGRYLSNNGMKKSGYSVGLMSAEQKTQVKKLGEALAELIPGVDFRTLVNMADGNVLIAAKVLESIYRRISRLYEYFDKGRVSYPGLEIR